MTNRPLCTDPRMISYGREIDANLRPVIDRILVELGMTRADLAALPLPDARMVGSDSVMPQAGGASPTTPGDTETASS